MAADLLFAELLDLVGEVDHAAGETQRDEQQSHEEADLHRVPVVARGGAAALVAARAARVALVAVAVGLLALLVERAVAVAVAQTVAGNGALLFDKAIKGR